MVRVEIEMKTIILPGFSLRNKEWALDIKEKLDLGHEVEVVFWRHWKKGGPLAINYELKKIKELTGNDKVNVIAKSVGARVIVNLIPLIRDKLEKIVLCGIPFKGFGEETKKKFKEALSSFPADKIICFQNKKDPFGSCRLIEEFIHSINPKISVVEKPGSDHHYPYPEDFQDFLE